MQHKDNVRKIVESFVFRKLRNTEPEVLAHLVKHLQPVWITFNSREPEIKSKVSKQVSVNKYWFKLETRFKKKYIRQKM